MTTDFSKMVELSDAELDAVCGGLITVIAVDLVDIDDVTVTVGDVASDNVVVAAIQALTNASENTARGRR